MKKQDKTKGLLAGFDLSPKGEPQQVNPPEPEAQGDLGEPQRKRKGKAQARDKGGRPRAFAKGEAERLTVLLHYSTAEAIRAALVKRDSEHRTQSELINAAVRAYLGLDKGKR